MKDKKNIYFIIISMIFVVSVLAFISYAWFDNTDIEGKLPLTVTIAPGLDANLNATGTDFTALNVSSDKMFTGDVGSVVGSSTSSINLSLTSSMPISCTYDLYWVWEEDSDKYKLSKENELEFTISGTNGTDVLEETQVSNFAGELYLGTYSIYVRGNEYAQNWEFTANFYNINANQDAHAEKTYKGKIEVQSAYCNNITLSDMVLSYESANDYTSSQDDTIYRVVEQNGVRYEGKDPDNYVYYNCTDESNTSTCEKWRIIGVFDGSEIGLTSGKKYTKIARSTPLEGGIAWDNDNGIYENDWVNSSLNAYLNGTYLSSLSIAAQGMIAKENNIYSKWYLLGPGNNYSGLYSQDWYLYERNSAYGKSGYKNGVQYGALGYTNAAIGLMYPSDYGYAAYGTSCDNETSMSLNYYEGGCAEVDWLLYDDTEEWLISPDSAGSYGAFNVSGTLGGYVDGLVVASEASVARPVLYLDDEVVISLGDGSSDAPYKIQTGSRTLNSAIFEDNTSYADNVASEFVSSSTGIDFSKPSSDTNGKGLYYTSANTEGNKTSYYFRGDVENNYVKFVSETITEEASCTYNGLPVKLGLTSDSPDANTKETCEQSGICIPNAALSSYPAVGVSQSICIKASSVGINGTWVDATPTWTDAKTTTKEFLWRIVRINEDGSIRLILEDSLDAVSYNTLTNMNSYNYYNGYMYGTTEDDYNVSNSKILDYLYNWSSKLSNYRSYLADVGYCNDREVVSIDGSGIKSYAFFTRSSSPVFGCSNVSRDLFTTSKSSSGNKALTFPIGLITADEAVYAGVVPNGVDNNYLLNGTRFWTMTPNTQISVYILGGNLPTSTSSCDDCLGTAGVLYDTTFNIKARPVINLKTNVRVTGTGTATDPYVVITK